jgi:hypothetical protein
MTTVQEILSAIEQLSLDERAELARRMHRWVDDDWDRETAADFDAGRLDKLLEEVDADVKAGRLRDLP